MPSRRRRPVACGIDIGSTNVKVVVVDPDGLVVAREGRPTPRDREGLSIATHELINTVEELISQVCAGRFQAEALCCVGVGEDGLLLDADLQPVTSALAWFDPRRQGILRTLQDKLDDTEDLDAAVDAARTMVGWLWARRQPGADRASTWAAVADLPAVWWTGRPFLTTLKLLGPVRGGPKAGPGHPIGSAPRWDLTASCPRLSPPGRSWARSPPQRFRSLVSWPPMR